MIQSYLGEEGEAVFLQLVNKFLIGTKFMGKIPPTEVLVDSIEIYAEIGEQSPAVREAFRANIRQAVETLRAVADTTN